MDRTRKGWLMFDYLANEPSYLSLGSISEWVKLKYNQIACERTWVYLTMKWTKFEYII